MNSDNTIQLSGPFSFTDSLGRLWQATGIRIYDEGYGTIDIYIDLAHSQDDEPLFEDPLVISQILWRLRTLGYNGPDFRPGDPGLQDDLVLVLEAPEEFCSFASQKGWRNLAEEYADLAGAADNFATSDIPPGCAAEVVYAALIQRLRER